MAKTAGASVVVQREPARVRRRKGESGGPREMARRERRE